MYSTESRLIDAELCKCFRRNVKKKYPNSKLQHQRPKRQRAESSLLGMTPIYSTVHFQSSIIANGGIYSKLR